MQTHWLWPTYIPYTHTYMDSCTTHTHTIHTTIHVLRRTHTHSIHTTTHIPRRVRAQPHTHSQSCTTQFPRCVRAHTHVIHTFGVILNQFTIEGLSVHCFIRSEDPDFGPWSRSPSSLEMVFATYSLSRANINALDPWKCRARAYLGAHILYI